ncbi:hypothetical protein BX070DRAFT_245632 [Coemansia spiralis]|nr:hypothetical protein BX070DRAFT_245632 [Coemansia spiralis]
MAQELASKLEQIRYDTASGTSLSAYSSPFLTTPTKFRAVNWTSGKGVRSSRSFTSVEFNLSLFVKENGSYFPLEIMIELCYCKNPLAALGIEQAAELANKLTKRIPNTIALNTPAKQNRTHMAALPSAGSLSKKLAELALYSKCEELDRAMFVWH